MNRNRLCLALALLAGSTAAATTASASGVDQGSPPDSGDRRPADSRAGKDKLRGSVGHYEGKGRIGGHPVSYDVSRNKAKGIYEISSLSFQTEAECWQDLNGDGADDVIVVEVRGLGGKVEPDGDFYIDVTPDEDNWYTVSGTLRRGKAKMEVLASGFWTLDGQPSASGPYECDSWGEPYIAKVQ